MIDTISLHGQIQNKCKTRKEQFWYKYMYTRIDGILSTSQFTGRSVLEILSIEVCVPCSLQILHLHHPVQGPEGLHNSAERCEQGCTE